MQSGIFFKKNANPLEFRGNKAILEKVKVAE